MFEKVKPCSTPSEAQVPPSSAANSWTDANRLMELDPHFCDVIIARWEKLTGKKAVCISGAE